MRNGLPRDSRATARAVRRPRSSLTSRSVIARRSASSGARGATLTSRLSASCGQRSRSSVRKGLCCSSLSRYVMRSRSAGARGGRSTWRRSEALSTSPHCASSTKRTIGCRSASDARSCRSASKARRRTSCGSSVSIGASSAIAGTRWSTGKSRARSHVSAGRGSGSLSSLSSVALMRCRLSESTSVSTALYGTASRSYARPRRMIASSLASPSRKWWTRVDLPIPDAPPTRRVTAAPARDASYAARSAASWASRPTKATAASLGASGAAGAELRVAPRRRRSAEPSGRAAGSRLRSATHSSSRSGGTPCTDSDGGCTSIMLFIVRMSIAEPTKGGCPTSAS